MLKHRKPLSEIVLPAGLWAGLLLSRPQFYALSCATKPAICTAGEVNEFDRIAFQFQNIFYDFWSNILQNGTGALVLILPWIWFRGHWRQSLESNYALFVATLWNAAILEIIRLLIQRPRPIVYSSPLIEGLNPNHYTAFYSGHTSFVTLAVVHAWFLTIRTHSHVDQKLVRRLSYLIGFSLIAATGWFRVLGGRHFPSDVIAGAFFGAAISILVNQTLNQNQSDRG